MTRASVVALATSIVTIVVVLAALEVARRRGMDPVARLADWLAPPMMQAPSATPAVAADASAAAASPPAASA